VTIAQKKKKIREFFKPILNLDVSLILTPPVQQSGRKLQAKKEARRIGYEMLEQEEHLLTIFLTILQLNNLNANVTQSLNWTKTLVYLYILPQIILLV
jgi:hypothetical protein